MPWHLRQRLRLHQDGPLPRSTVEIIRAKCTTFIKGETDLQCHWVCDNRGDWFKSKLKSKSAFLAFGCRKKSNLSKFIPAARIVTIFTEVVVLVSRISFQVTGPYRPCPKKYWIWRALM